VNKYVSCNLIKYDEKLPPEKWKDLISIAFDGREKVRVLTKKNESQVLKSKEILKEPMQDLLGGQLIEVAVKAGDKEVGLVLCQLPTKLVMIRCEESLNTAEKVGGMLMGKLGKLGAF
jgi:hypothetical protein